MDGFQVMSMEEAAKIGDIFITVTGNIHVIREEHFKVMKDGALVCNSGHFDVELDLVALAKIATNVRKGVREFVDEFTRPQRQPRHGPGRRPPDQPRRRPRPPGLASWTCPSPCRPSPPNGPSRTRASSTAKVYNVPAEIDAWVAKLKLQSMGVSIDTLTAEQVKYLASHDMGT